MAYERRYLCSTVTELIRGGVHVPGYEQDSAELLDSRNYAGVVFMDEMPIIEIPWEKLERIRNGEKATKVLTKDEQDWVISFFQECVALTRLYQDF